MTPEMLQVFFAVFAVWGILVALKAAKAVRGTEPYTFSMWDGGMMRVGKSLTRSGAWFKLVAGACIGAGCVASLGHVFPPNTGGYVVAFFAVLSVSADFVLIDKR